MSNGRRGDIGIQPTIIANGVQFRGEIDNATILEFLCAGFEKGDAPPICLQGGTADADQCQESKFGAIACKARGMVDGMTRCVGTGSFPYWTCACPRGSVSVSGTDGLPRCAVINQCLTSAAGVPECNCPTCICRNMPDSQPPQCSSVVDECTINNGNCWAGTLGGKQLTACVNDIEAKRKVALAGQDPNSVRGHKCVCPTVRGGVWGSPRFFPGLAPSLGGGVAAISAAEGSAAERTASAFARFSGHQFLVTSIPFSARRRATAATGCSRALTWTSALRTRTSAGRCAERGEIGGESSEMRAGSERRRSPLRPVVVPGKMRPGLGFQSLTLPFPSLGGRRGICRCASTR